MLTDEQVAEMERKTKWGGLQSDQWIQALLVERAELQAAWSKAVSDYEMANNECVNLEVAFAEWRLALQSLTPMGSEYVTPQQCVDYVRSLRAPAALKAAKEEVERLRGLLRQGREAIRLTREYADKSGLLLPPIDGWSWWDAIRAIDEALGESTAPADQWVKRSGLVANGGVTTAALEGGEG